MKVTLVAPCYNEEGNVREFYKEVQENFDGFYDYQVVFVNDGSKDNTLSVLKELAGEEKEKIKVIDFSRNFGKESAMYAGLKNADGDYVAIIDADLQQPPAVVKIWWTIWKNIKISIALPHIRTGEKKINFSSDSKIVFTTL